ncbi:MAG: hypothetical protein AB7P07_08280 [Hyphomonadaceae bacterium]
MRSRGARTIPVNPVPPVDEEPRARQITDHPDRGRMEAIMDQKLFWQRIKSERASAYWFAASVWGVGGLVVGALLGGYMMFQAYVGLSEPVRDTLIQGQAIQAAQDSVNSRPSLVDPARNQPNQP